MARIQFSKEVFEKLKNSTLDENTAILMSKFDPNRPFKGQGKINKKPKESLDKTEKQSRKELAQELHAFRQAHKISVPKKVKKKTLRSTQIKASERRLIKKMARIEDEKKKLERVRRISDQVKTTTHFSIFSPGLSNVSHTRTTRTQSKNKPIYDNRGNDAYDFAGEYSAHNVEYGHGRRKSDEWNNSVALDLKHELDNLRKIQKDDPNTFDHGAMK